MNSANDNKLLSNLAEFVDSRLEREYVSFDLSSSMRCLRPLILSFGFLYFLFAIPDYFLITDVNKLAFIFINRLVFLALVVFLYVKIDRLKSYTLHYWITAYEIILSIFFLSIVYIYESPNFLVDTFWIVLTIVIFFLVPNRWIYTVFVSLFLAFSFFVISRQIFGPQEAAHYLAAVAYVVLIIVILGTSSFRINSNKRLQYIHTKELQKLSITDSLTGIYNRLKFEEELKIGISMAKRYGIELSVILFDFDDFKNINDQYGHLTGDQVLMAVARLVQNSIRETDVLARWGGEEFAILLPNTGKEQAVETAERLRSLISSGPFDPVQEVTCSFGVASLEKGDDRSTLMQRVDKLLFAAKRTGKNQIAA